MKTDTKNIRKKNKSAKTLLLEKENLRRMKRENRENIKEENKVLKLKNKEDSKKAKKEKIREENKKEKKESNNNSDRNKYFENYELQTDFQVCALCGFEGGINILTKIDDDIESLFISCGLQEYYQNMLIEMEYDNINIDYINDIKDTFTEFGTMKKYIYICKPCYNIIRTKKRKEKTTKGYTILIIIIIIYYYYQL